MRSAVAHVTFVGGGFTLAVETAYDRQLLVDYVLDCARRKHEVAVRVDHTTWRIERAEAQHPIVCRACARRIDHAVSHCDRRTTAYCLTCALGHPHLTIGFLTHLPRGTILRDVQAYWAYDGAWVPWTRWPQATPAEIIDDMRLQRRYAPVLTWHCMEICRPSAPAGRTLGTRLTLHSNKAA
jgi:hypothetical protein